MHTENLFKLLSKYPTSDKNRPIENFITEALKYFFLKDKNILSDLINKYVAVGDITIKCINTQVHYRESYFDIYIEFYCDERDHCLVIENKIWSKPWENIDKTGKSSNQIDHYCKLLHENCLAINHVLLLSPYVFQQPTLAEESLRIFKKNITWDMMSSILAEHVSESSNYGTMLKEFIQFLKEENMAVDSIRQKEIDTIKYMHSYDVKLRQIAEHIRRFLKEKYNSLHESFKSHDKLKLHDAHGDDPAWGHHGLILHLKNFGVGWSPLWILSGIATRHGADYFPELLKKEELIPDIQTLFWMEFDNREKKETFLATYASLLPCKESDTFERLEHETAYIIIRRKTLADFVDTDREENQLQKILDYLEIGLQDLSACDGLRNLVDLYVQQHHP